MNSLAQSVSGFNVFIRINTYGYQIPRRIQMHLVFSWPQMVIDLFELSTEEIAWRNSCGVINTLLIGLSSHQLAYWRGLVVCKRIKKKMLFAFSSWGKSTRDCTFPIVAVSKCYWGRCLVCLFLFRKCLFFFI